MVTSSSTTHQNFTSEWHSDLSEHESNRLSTSQQKHIVSVSWATTEWNDDSTNSSSLILPPPPSTSQHPSLSSSSSSSQTSILLPLTVPTLSTSSSSSSVPSFSSTDNSLTSRQSHHLSRCSQPHRRHLRRRHSQQSSENKVANDKCEHKNTTNQKKSNFEKSPNPKKTELCSDDRHNSSRTSNKFSNDENFQSKVDISLHYQTDEISNESLLTLKIDENVTTESEDTDRSGYAQLPENDTLLLVNVSPPKSESKSTEHNEATPQLFSKNNEESDPQESNEADEDYTLSPQHISRTFPARNRSTKRVAKKELQALISTSHRFNQMWTPSSPKRKRPKSLKIK